MEPSNDAYFAPSGGADSPDDVPPADAGTAEAATKAATSAKHDAASGSEGEGEREEAKGSESASAAASAAESPKAPATPAAAPAAPAAAADEDDAHKTPVARGTKGGKGAANPMASPIPEMIMSTVRKLGPVVFTPTHVLQWKNPAISGAAFALGFAGIYYGPLAVVELALLLAVLAGGSVKAANAWGVGGTAKAPLPTPRIPLTREGLDGMVEGIADALVASIAFLNGVMAWKDARHSLRACAYVWLLFTFGGLSVLLLSRTLQQAAFVALFALPVVWADLKAAALRVVQAQVAPAVAQLRAHVSKAKAAVVAAAEGKSPTVVMAVEVAVIALGVYVWMQLLPLRTLATAASLAVVAVDVGKVVGGAAGLTGGAAGAGATDGSAAATTARPKSD